MAGQAATDIGQQDLGLRGDETVAGLDHMEADATAVEVINRREQPSRRIDGLARMPSVPHLSSGR